MATPSLASRLRTEHGQKAFRYTLVSLISVAVTQVVLFGLQQVFAMAARPANIIAVIAGGVPSYTLNRRWAWGKSGKSHLWREVVPFWALAFAGLVLSVWAVDFAETWGRVHLSSQLYQHLLVNFANIAAFGVLWIGKYVIFNKMMFVEHHGSVAD